MSFSLHVLSERPLIIVLFFNVPLLLALSFTLTSVTPLSPLTSGGRLISQPTMYIAALNPGDQLAPARHGRLLGPHTSNECEKKIEGYPTIRYLVGKRRQLNYSVIYC